MTTDTYTCNPPDGPLRPVCIYTLAYDLYRDVSNRIYDLINVESSEYYNDNRRLLLQSLFLQKQEHANDLNVCEELVKALREEQKETERRTI